MKDRGICLKVTHCQAFIKTYQDPISCLEVQRVSQGQQVVPIQKSLKVCKSPEGSRDLKITSLNTAPCYFRQEEKEHERFEGNSQVYKVIHLGHKAWAPDARAFQWHHIIPRLCSPSHPYGSLMPKGGRTRRKTEPRGGRQELKTEAMISNHHVVVHDKCKQFELSTQN